MTVSALKQICARTFKCELALVRLSVRDSPESYPSLMDDDMKTLSYYAVSDGSEVLIEEIDPRDLARQAEQEARQKEAEIKRQVSAPTLPLFQLDVNRFPDAMGACVLLRFLSLSWVYRW